MSDSADIHNMEHDYQNMRVEERVLHHDELRTEGYEWCPECGEVLVWDLPSRRSTDISSGSAPIVTGDCPPLTRDQLLSTAPGF